MIFLAAFIHTCLTLLMYQAVGMVHFLFGMRSLITLSKKIWISFRPSQTNSYKTNQRELQLIIVIVSS
jgi:hypothetical protein